MLENAQFLKNKKKPQNMTPNSNKKSTQNFQILNSKIQPTKTHKKASKISKF
jgi:hypothetical protein